MESNTWWQNMPDLQNRMHQTHQSQQLDSWDWQQQVRRRTVCNWNWVSQMMLLPPIITECWKILIWVFSKLIKWRHIHISTRETKKCGKSCFSEMQTRPPQNEACEFTGCSWEKKYAALRMKKTKALQIGTWHGTFLN